LDILRHDRYSLRMDGAEIGVFEQPNEIGFDGLLEGKNGGALEAKVGLEVLGNFPDKTLERKFADEQFSALLILPNLSESDCSRSVSMRLLHSSTGRSRLPGGLGG